MEPNLAQLRFNVLSILIGTSDRSRDMSRDVWRKIAII